MENLENKVLWISEEEAIECGVLDMKFILDCVITANKMLGRNETIEIPLVHMLWEENKHSGKRIGLHACVINSDTENIHISSTKSIPSNPTNPKKLHKPRSNGIVLLFDEETGYPRAVVDDTLSSGMRTGAGSALGAKCFARPDSEVVGLLGSGIIAGYCLWATSLLMKNIKKVKVYDIIPENAKRFCEKWGEKLGYEMEVVDSAEAAVRDSDIVHACTLCEMGHPYIPAAWIKPGSFQSEVSQYDYMNECFLKPGMKFGTDMLERLKDPWSWGLGDLCCQGKLDPKDCVQVSQVLLGQHPGRTSDKDTYMFGTLGMVITDTTICYRIYQQCVEKGMGTWVYQWHKPAMV